METAIFICNRMTKNVLKGKNTKNLATAPLLSKEIILHLQHPNQKKTNQKNELAFFSTLPSFSWRFP
jgi:hypothetical protein